jgi:hypothetical protein
MGAIQETVAPAAPRHQTYRKRFLVSWKEIPRSADVTSVWRRILKDIKIKYCCLIRVLYDRNHRYLGDWKSQKTEPWREIMGGVKKRNMLAQVCLMIITLGIYAIYWFYSTAEELKYLANDKTASPALWTVLLFVPFGCFFSWYKYSELYEKVSSDSLNMWILFILWIVFSPAVWFIVQTELNKRAA